MAKSVAVPVTETAVQIHPPTGFLRPLAIHNDGSSTAFLGGSDVTAATGFPIGEGDDVMLTLGAEEDLYAICDTAGTATLRVLGTGSF